MAEGAKTKETITLEEARRVIDAAERKAEEIGQPMDIAVVDAGGTLKAHARMDGCVRRERHDLDQQSLQRHRFLADSEPERGCATLSSV